MHKCSALPLWISVKLLSGDGTLARIILYSFGSKLQRDDYKVRLTTGKMCWVLQGGQYVQSSW